MKIVQSYFCFSLTVNIIANISTFVNIEAPQPAILPSVVIVKNWLDEAVRILKVAGIITARLDTLVLLEDAFGKDRAWLLAHQDSEIPASIQQELNEKITRRAHHEPLAYIRGKAEFFGREFIVSPATLQPRPETETMIELLKSLALPDGTTVADIGTGSGAIAITTKLERPHLIVHGTEIQPDALAIAHKNREKLAADVMLHEGDLLNPLMHTKIEVILANLPYVPDSHTINEAAMQEPAIAIFGGKDGLTPYRQLFTQITQRAQKPTHILTESLPFQHADLASIASTQGYQLQTSQDFIQLFSLD